MIQKFSRPISPKEWSIFLHNCHRVRCIRYYDDTVWSDQSMLEIASTRPTDPIFPNLRMLTLGTHPKPHFTPYIMHHTVSGIDIEIECIENFSWTVPHIVSRMPNITTLNLTSGKPMESVEHSLEGLLQYLPKLETLTLSLYCLLASAFSALSSHESVRVIKWRGADDDDICGSPFDFLHFAPVLEEHSFPALKELQFAATAADASTFISQPHFRSIDLTSLCVRTVFLDDKTNDQIRALLTSISEVCTSLERLEIAAVATKLDEDISEEMNLLPPVTFSDIASLTRMRNLKVFIFHTLHPIKMTDENAEYLASCLPGIEELCLNVYPSFESPPTLTLHSLTPFAVHCPSLTRLGLYMKTDFPHGSRSSLQLPCPSVRANSTSLQILDIGHASHFTTDPRDIPPICDFLFSVLPAGCVVKVAYDTQMDGKDGTYLADEPEWAMDRRFDSTSKENYSFWGGVNGTLKLMEKTRAAAIESRKEEMENLKERLVSAELACEAMSNAMARGQS